MTTRLDDAIAALRNGDQPRAMTLLQAQLDDEPSDTMAWLWMSEATPDIRRKVEALSQFLTLAPNHSHAAAIRLRLEQLQTQLAAMSPAIEPEARHDLSRDRADDLPASAPVAQPEPLAEKVTDEGLTPPPPPSDTTVSLADEPRLDDDASQIDISDAGNPIPSPTFSPRPAAPPPPNFEAGRADEDDGLPLWVWVLMVLSLALVALFIYVILNFEQFNMFLP